MSADDGRLLPDLEQEVETELSEARSSREAPLDVAPADWLFDPTEADREEVGLRNILGGVQALEGTLRTDRD